MNEYVSVVLYTLIAILLIPLVFGKINNNIQNDSDEDHYQNMNG